MGVGELGKTTGLVMLFFFWFLVKLTLSASTVANLKSQILTRSPFEVWAPASPATWCVPRKLTKCI